MVPKNISEFYPYSVHLIYAVIIAQSFSIASNLIIPINSIFTDFSQLVLSAELFLAYFIIISGWIGYTRSISRKPHKDNLKGTIRFSLDLLILFEFFYLLDIIPKLLFPSQFLSVLVVIFITYVVWDFVKYKEYPQKNLKSEKRSRSGRTLILLIGFFILTSLYYFLNTNNDELIFVSDDARELIFIIITGILILVYRVWKWKPAPTRKRIKSNT